MNIKIIFFKFFLLNVLHITSSYCQQGHPSRPFAPIEYGGLDPIWNVTSYDNTFVGDSCDEYNYFFSPANYHVKQVFWNGSIFTATYRLGKAQLSGTYIEKRDLLTGNLQWQAYYGIGATERAEFARFMFINTNGDLEILSQIYPVGYDPIDVGLFGCSEMLFSKRIYNIDDGSLLLFEHPEYDDDEAIRSDFTFIYNALSNSFTREGNQFRFFNVSIAPNFDRYYHSSLINYNTLKRDHREDSLKVEYVGVPGPPIKVDENKYLCVEVVDSFHILFRYVDKNLNVLEEYYSDSLSYHIHWIRKKGYNPINNTFLFYNQLPPTSAIKPIPFEVFVLDDKAKIVSKVNFENDYLDFEVVNWLDPDNLSFIATQNPYLVQKRFRPTLLLLSASGIDVKPKIVKRFEPNDTLRWSVLFDFVSYDNDKYIVQYTQGAHENIYKRDVNARAVRMMLIDKKTFDITNSIIDEQTEKLSLFPNPAMDQIHISHTGIEVYQVTLTDISGREVLRDVGGADITSLSTAHLPSGWYVATIWSADGKRYVEKIVIQ
jgi:Secretion system C-terminal sorting domain